MLHMNIVVSVHLDLDKLVKEHHLEVLILP